MNRQFCLIYIFVFLFSILCTKGQFIIPGNGIQQVVGGYANNPEGETLPYFSSYQQFAKEALLTRCTNGNKKITWQSAEVPLDFKGDFCYFYFLAGHSTGTSKADRHFDFFINGQKYLTFVTPQKKKPPFTWIFSGKDSVQLIFDATFQDIHTDAHGNLFLKVPRKLIVPGKPLSFSITGHKENSNDWFMIFNYQYVEKIIVEPSSLLVQVPEGIKQLIRIKADHTFPTGDTLQMNLFSRNYFFILHPGYNYFELPVDTVSEIKDEIIRIREGDKYHSEIHVRLQPVRRREVDIIHHSHNDIGYSNLQEDVAAIQTNNIRTSLKLIEQTKNYPEGSRFIWNIESMWAVDNFLTEATEDEKQNFFTAVRAGKIGLSGYYANVLTGLCKPEELDWITERAVQLRNEFNLPVNSVMFTDIPGVIWSDVKSLYDHGFRYFSCGPNYQPQYPDLGERIGGTLLELGDRPFYWKSENGKSKILFWVAGRGYSMFHQIPFADLDEKRKDKLADYMNALDSTGYPYDIVQLRYAIKTDNGPTDSTLCDFVKNWNEKYVSPKLRISSVGDMMHRFESKYGKQLPVLSGDFTPYWEDGAYSTAKEEGETRVLSERIIQLQKFHELNPEIKVDTTWFYLARRNVVMFHEHTWGSWNSISEPDVPFTTRQWEYKKKFSDSANFYVKKIENAMMPERTNYRKIEAWNTLPWKRNGIVELIPPSGMDSLMLTDQEGRKIPFQHTSDGKLCFIAYNIPPFGKKIYSIVPYKAKTGSFSKFKSWEASIDSSTGVMKSLKRKFNELIDTTIFHGINTAIYISGNDPELFSSTSVKKIEHTSVAGPVFDELIITCSLDGCNEVKYFLTQFKGLPDLINCTTIIDKKAVREKESVHIAFPFAFKNAITRIGIGDTCMIPGHGQLAAANSDFYSVQRWLDVSDPSGGITLSSPQCALFEIGSMIDERRINNGEKLWKKKNSSSSLLFAYAMNNYWNTNYKADQEGIARFDFNILLHDKFSLQKSKRFGIESNQPLLILQK